MKLIAEITLQIQNEKLPELLGVINSYGCEIKLMELREGHGSQAVYFCEIMYTKREQFKSLIDSGIKDVSVEILELRDMLDEQLDNGLIRVEPKSDIQNSDDFDLKIMAPYSLALEKIREGNGSTALLSINRNVAIVTGSHTQLNEYTDGELELYLNSEKDAAFLSVAARFNGYPILVRFAQVEDFIKCIREISPGFAALRIAGLLTARGFDVYQQLTDEHLPPVLRHELDEVPLYLLVHIWQALKQSSAGMNSVTIGIIGINASCLRLTRLLSREGHGRVLGYDNNERLMLSLESEGGLATNPENIFGNADILLLFKNNYTIDDFYRIQPGQVIYYQVDDEDIDFQVVEEKGLKGAFRIHPSRAAMLAPGLLLGMIDAGIHVLSDAMLTGIAGMLEKNNSDLDATGQMVEHVQEKIRQYCIENA